MYEFQRPLEIDKDIVSLDQELLVPSLPSRSKWLQIWSITNAILYWWWLLHGLVFFFGTFILNRFSCSLYVLTVDDTNATWTLLADEILQLLAYYSEGLGGRTESDIPRKWPVRKSKLFFGPLGMCRLNTLTSAFSCYRGFGLDVPGMIVRDFGTQVGYMGEVPDPRAFGLTTEEIFHQAIREIERILVNVTHSMLSPCLDSNKTAVIFMLRKIRVVAIYVQVVWYILLFSFLLLCLMDIFILFLPGNVTLAKLSIGVIAFFVGVSGILMILKIVCPIVYNYHFGEYGLQMSLGLAYYFELFHWLSSFWQLKRRISYLTALI